MKPPPRHRRRFLTKNEWRDLLSTAKKDGQKSFTILYLLYRFCLRVGELCRLELGFLTKLDDGMIYIEREKGSTSGWLDDVTAADRKVLGAWIKKLYPSSKDRRVSAPLFIADHRWCGSKNRPLSRFAVYRLIQRLGRAAGLDAALAHPHAIRHARLQHIVEAGVMQGLHHMDLVPVLAKLAGHATARTTVEHYISETSGGKKLIRDVTKAMLND